MQKEKQSCQGTQGAGLTGLGQPQLGPAADDYANHRRLQNLEHVGRADADA